ncbi:MAG: patatin-like phospholipase family protein [Bacteroidia bacterium]|nr:patatin-like phospholipase family protein [Bacteroidia bacterium]NNJ56142.1 phospholipase [Bacteroidia bacterium]
MVSKKQPISLVLSGGGARGLAHIGVIEELLKQGYEIKSIAGTSMGSVVGGIHALGKLNEFKEWMYTLDRRKVFNLVDFAWRGLGIIKGDRVLDKIKEFIQDENIEDLNIPFVAVATDIQNNEEIVFKKGSVFDAIRASIAIPTVITPVETDKGLLVDGGVLNNIPVSRVVRTKNDKLVVVDVNALIPVYKPKISKKKQEEQESDYLKKIKRFYNQLQKIIPSSAPKEEKLGYLDLIEKSMNLMMHQSSNEALKKYKPDVLIKVSRDSCSAFDFYKAEELVEIGRHAAKLALEEQK